MDEPLAIKYDDGLLVRKVRGTGQGSDWRSKAAISIRMQCVYMEVIFEQKPRIFSKITNLGPGDDISAGDELVQEGAPQLLVLHEVLLPRQNLR
jgi:hypothetical protein